MEIREVREQDRAQYLQMVAEFYATDSVIAPIPEDYARRTFDALCTGSPFAVAWILELDGQTAGYALGAVTFSQEAGGKVLWLEELYVRPAWRGRGLASGFLARLPALTDAVRLRLEVMPGHEHLRQMYAAHGFMQMPYQQMYRTRSL